VKVKIENVITTEEKIIEIKDHNQFLQLLSLHRDIRHPIAIVDVLGHDRIYVDDSKNKK